MSKRTLRFLLPLSIAALSLIGCGNDNDDDDGGGGGGGNSQVCQQAGAYIDECVPGSNVSGSVPATCVGEDRAFAECVLELSCQQIMNGEVADCDQGGGGDDVGMSDTGMSDAGMGDTGGTTSQECQLLYDNVVMCCVEGGESQADCETGAAPTLTLGAPACTAALSQYANGCPE